jgi:hypothetical protein
MLPQRTEYEILVNHNYRQLKNQVGEGDRPILKALIMMKSKQREFNLSDGLNQDLLDVDCLWKRLYE